MLNRLLGADHVKSRVLLTDATENAIFKFGESDSYVDFYVQTSKGLVPARITMAGLVDCVERGRKQRAEIGPPARPWHFLARF